MLHPHWSHKSLSRAMEKDKIYLTGNLGTPRICKTYVDRPGEENCSKEMGREASTDALYNTSGKKSLMQGCTMNTPEIGVTRYRTTLGWARFTVIQDGQFLKLCLECGHSTGSLEEIFAISGVPSLGGYYWVPLACFSNEPLESMSLKYQFLWRLPNF